jgi:hypothetical protein
MGDVLSTDSNFKSLSIKDLLQARDLYHYHLMNKPNVVGTAIGLYFIRNSDPTPEEQRELEKRAREGGKPLPKKGVRRLDNSGIREYSWPCVHAFVRKWVDDDEFGGGSGQLHPQDMVPKTLYMPDGRMVPVCVTLVEQGAPAPTVPRWKWPGGLFGGGMPIAVQTQERERVATSGGLVTDGHKIYALTSRHVCGNDGEPVYTFAAGTRTRIGTGSALHLSRLPFTDVYPEFVGRRTFVNLDVGLIELDDVNAWTSRYIGIGAVEALADLNELNISVRLIDAEVVAIGAASGLLEGRIKALFYRFKSVGGYDYVADFFIGPRDFENRGTSQTRPGDSGAVWHLVTQPDASTRAEADSTVEPLFKPLAVEWGGQVFVGSGGAEQFAFALATSLTTVCHALNVELVLEHNLGALPYWGQVGHYSIATFAGDALPDGDFKTFMLDNVDRISFVKADLNAKAIAAALKDARENKEQIPLADVPDLVWKTYYKNTGGRDTKSFNGRTTGPEHPTHFADIDEELEGKSLLERCLEDTANVSVEAWQAFFDALEHTKENERGLLPFRVWQFFDAMVDFATEKSADKFLCAAGLLSHYVGDACQPLHGSMYADGYADKETTVTHTKRDTGEVVKEKSHQGAGVHSTYETKMVDRKAQDLIEGIPQYLPEEGDLPEITTGKEAAVAIVQLMGRTAERLPPTDIVDAYIAAGGKAVVAVQDALWEQFGEKTKETMADGAAVLASIWLGAWKAGNGSKIPKSKLGAIEPTLLKKYYEDTKFVESLNLDDIGKVLR